MAKIGTAHIELKPVLSEDALEAISERIADAVAQGVERGMASIAGPTIINNVAHTSPADGVEREHDLGDGDCWCNPEVVKVCGCTWCRRGLDHPTP